MANKKYTKEEIEKMTPEQVEEVKQTKVDLTYQEFTEILEEIYYLGFRTAKQPMEAVIQKLLEDLKPNYDLISSYLISKDSDFEDRREGKGGKIITHTFLKKDNE